MTSEKIKQFLDFVDECFALNSMADDGIATEAKRQQDLLHAIEFEPSAKERSKLCTKLHKCRLERRRYKDMFEETDEIVQFFSEPVHKKTLDQMRQLLGKVRKVEKYHESRTYIPRIKEETKNENSKTTICNHEKQSNRNLSGLSEELPF